MPLPFLIGAGISYIGGRAAGIAYRRAKYGHTEDPRKPWNKAKERARKRATEYIEKNRIAEVGVQTNAYGTPIAQVYGTYKLAGNVIWPNHVDIAAGIPIREDTNPDLPEPLYYGTFAIGVCKGPVQQITRMWFNDILVMDVRADVEGSPFIADDILMRVYLGTEDQMPDPKIVEFDGDSAGGGVPAFRGLCYTMFENIPLAPWGNAIPNVTFEVTANAVELCPWEDLGIEVPKIDLAQSETAVRIAGELIDSGEPDNMADGDLSTYCDASPVEGLTEIYDEEYKPITNRAYAGLTWPTFYTPDTEPVTDGDVTHGVLTDINSGTLGGYVRIENEGTAYVGFEWNGSTASLHPYGILCHKIRFKCPAGRTPPCSTLKIWMRVSGVWRDMVAYYGPGYGGSLDALVLVEGEWIEREFLIESGGQNVHYNWQITGIRLESSTGKIECEQFEVYSYNERNGEYYGVAWPEPVTWDRLKVWLSEAQSEIGWGSDTQIYLHDGAQWLRQTGGSGEYHFPLEYEGDLPGKPGTWVAGECSTPQPANTSYGVMLKFGDETSVAEFQVYNGHWPAEGEVEGADDAMVMTPDEAAVVITDKGVWWRYDLQNDSVTVTKDHRNGGVPQYPALGCDFDIDERGKIYTAKGADDHYDGQVVRLDGDTLEYLGSDPNTTFQNPKRVRVSRNPTHPYVVIIERRMDEDVRNNLYVFDRDGRDVAQGLHFWYALSIDNFEWYAMDIDDEHGVLWVLMRGFGPNEGQAKVSAYQLGFGLFAPAIMMETYVSPDAANAIVIRYDPESQRLMVGTREPEEKIVFFAWEPTTFWLGYDSEITGEVVPASPKSAWRRGPVGGELTYAYSGSTIHRLNLASREIVRSWTVAAQQGVLPTWQGGSLYDTGKSSIITGCSNHPPDYVRVWLDQVLTAPATISSIVESICEQAGLGVEEIDASDLDAIRTFGYLINSRSRARDFIEGLAGAHFFDQVESDEGIRFARWDGRTSVATIPEEHLATHDEGEEPPPLLAMARKQEIDLPQAVEATFPDLDKNYESGLARTTNDATASIEAAAVNMPEASFSFLAKQVSDESFFYAWLQRNPRKAYVPRDYARLQPGDVITIVKDLANHLMLIENLSFQGQVIELELTDYWPYDGQKLSP